MKIRNSSATFVLSAFAICTMSAGWFGSAHAAPIVDFNVTVNGGGGGPFNDMWSQTGLPQGTPGLFAVQHSDAGSPYPSGLNPTGEWSILWNITADDDPNGGGMATGAQIGAGFTVTNLLPELPNPADNNLQFSIVIQMDVMAANNTQFFGSGGMTLLAPGGSGSSNMISTTGGPIFSYLIDGASVASLFPSGFFLDISGPGTNSTSQNLTAGQTGPLAGISPNSIGIALNFNLTPGETVTFNGTWAFIPTPGALALLAIAGATGRSRRRRE